MPDVTIIIPVANYHRDVAPRAIASANAQTVACEVFVYEDTESKGAGYARNRALKEVETKYVIFLDSDDEISPNFVQRCLSVIRPNHYVYTDWYLDGEVQLAPEHCWQVDTKQWHVITTLLPTDAVKAIGGFDETLQAGEDAHFYYALTRSGVCGIAHHEPLFTYGRESQRSQILYEKVGGNLRFTPYYEQVMFPLFERYKNMACCGGDSQKPVFVPAQPGDIEALAIWGGNRREVGSISGRLYPRGGNGNPMSVDPRDVDASPEKWRRIPVAPQSAPAILAHERPQPTVIRPPAKPLLDGVGALVEAVYPGVKVIREDTKVLTADELAATLPAIKANVPAGAKKISKLTGRGKGKK